MTNVALFLHFFFSVDDGEMYVMQTLLEYPAQPETYQAEEVEEDHLNRSNSSDPSPAERSISTAQIHSWKEDDTTTLRSQNSRDSKTVSLVQ